MSEDVEFHVKLGTRGRVCIPKLLVESYRLWVGTKIKAWAKLEERYSKLIKFESRIRHGFVFTIPFNERRLLKAKTGDILEITISEWEPPNLL